MARDTGGGRIVVVCAPGNVNAIISLLESVEVRYCQLRYIVQPSPTGPVNAFFRGLECCSSEDTVMMLCGDNVIGENTWGVIRHTLTQNSEANLIVAGRLHTYRDAGRFTTIVNMDQDSGNYPRWKFYHGTQDLVDKGHLINCWVGPVLFRGAILKALTDGSMIRYDNFSGLFNVLSRRLPLSTVLFKSDAMDVGVPEELP